MVALRSGSLEILCGLRGERHSALDEDLGEQALAVLLGGIAGAADPSAPLPEGYDRGVVDSLVETGRLFDRGVARITFHLETRGGHQTAIYTPEMRNGLLLRARERPAHPQAVEGRLAMGDFRDTTLRCRVDTLFNGSLTCSFSEQQKDAVLAALTHYVRIIGEAPDRDSEPQAMTIQSIEILDQSPPADDHPAARSFFSAPPDLERLAAEQGVHPVADFDSLLGDFWPEDETTEEFLSTLAAWRREGASGGIAGIMRGLPVSP